MTTSVRRCPDVPHNTWYVAARADQVGRLPLARTILGRPVVLYRTAAGDAVALEDRCAHRPVRLSRGEVQGDDLRSTYTGFVYAPDGRCVAVPTQATPPYDVRVPSFPVHEDGTFTWVWLGDPGLASLRRPPSTSWLRSPEWHTFGGDHETRAAVGLLWDNFGDITHVAQLDPSVAPPAVGEGVAPPLEVEVSETTVRFSRDWPASRLLAWNAQVLEVPADAEHAQREAGEFLAPGLWVDRWSVTVRGHGERDGVHTLVFTHALTPTSETSTQHLWSVSRDFSASSAAEGTMRPLLQRYYDRVRDELEQMQAVLDADGPRDDVALASDAAVSQVRRIVRRMVADEVARD